MTGYMYVTSYLSSILEVMYRTLPRSVTSPHPLGYICIDHTASLTNMPVSDCLA